MCSFRNKLAILQQRFAVFIFLFFDFYEPRSIMGTEEAIVTIDIIETVAAMTQTEEIPGTIEVVADGA